MSEAVKDPAHPTSQSADHIIRQMAQYGGFTAPKVAMGVDVLEAMNRDKECLKFLSFPANIVSTGTRGVLRELVERKMVDVIITTCGTLDHDLARLWGDYLKGSFDADDKELRKKGVHRLGNVFVPQDVYGAALERKLQPWFAEYYGKGMREFATWEFCKALGESISKEKRAKETILYWAWKNNIPMIIPGPTDGAVGLQAWTFSQDHKGFHFNLFKDESLLHQMTTEAKKTGALMIGGGISKHHVIWWNQFRDGLDYAVQITTAPEWDGSLSGARVKEGISWHKVKPNAPQVTIEGDATVLMPLMVGALLERLG